jgi:serine/threonine protein kinase
MIYGMIEEQPLPYRRIDNYIIQSRLEDGGMSSVYKGFDVHRQQDVVIKILHERYLKDENIVQRFQQEIEIAKELHHTHIVPFFGFGEIDGKAYMILKYMSGGSLSDAIKRKNVSLADTAKWIKQIASALDYAHQRGVIHRDIKPGNILLDANGDANVTDFGIARVVDAKKLTRTDVSMPGTARFMSPEQAIGKQIDSRSDIYSLAVLAYTLCVGDYPFDGANDVAIVVQHINANPPRPNGKNPALPRTLDKVILRGLSKNPDSRYQTAGDFAIAFQAALNAEPAPPPLTEHRRPIIAPTDNYQAIPPQSPRWITWLMMAGIMIVISAVMIIGFMAISQRNTRTPETPIIPQLTDVDEVAISATDSPNEQPTVNFSIEPTAPQSFSTVTPVQSIDALISTFSADMPTSTPRLTSTPTPTLDIPLGWSSGTRLYIQYETGIRPYVGGDPLDEILEVGDMVTISQGIVEGGALREWFGTEPNRWWYVIPMRGSSGWLPEDAIAEEPAPPEGIPTRTPTPTQTLTPTATP